MSASRTIDGKLPASKAMVGQSPPYKTGFGAYLRHRCAGMTTLGKSARINYFFKSALPVTMLNPDISGQAG